MPNKSKEYTVEVQMCVKRTYLVTASTPKGAKDQAKSLIYHEVMIDDPDIDWDFVATDGSQTPSTPPWAG
ncbi:hypothetical protein UFOVP418_40 [uncultured Caudovirales phage]|uniref:Uncharacterized protein n=1 Tax=uncultured Caudovirales phage TaxID=2100421 RepID=A0A6J5M5T8_9CAUD|nr:hypothetical protein UFOVP418_40 [uncultured Caudovirales phage]